MWHYPHLDLGFLVSRAVREWIDVVLAIRLVVICYDSPRNLICIAEVFKPGASDEKARNKEAFVHKTGPGHQLPPRSESWHHHCSDWAGPAVQFHRISGPLFSWSLSLPCICLFNLPFNCVVPISSVMWVRLTWIYTSHLPPRTEALNGFGQFSQIILIE